MRSLSNGAMLKFTYIWAISEGIGGGVVVVADIKEADIEYSFFAVWGVASGREDIYELSMRK
jgi:hypothetical protein